MTLNKEHIVDKLLEIATCKSYPDESLEAAKVILVHDLAVALRAGALMDGFLEKPEETGHGSSTDLLTGSHIDIATAVSRNGQLIHALTLDDTLLAAGTHVGATSIPLLLAFGEREGMRLVDLLGGLAAAFAAAEQLGQPILSALSAKGIRPTPVIGPPAAVIGIAYMLRWDEDRTRRAIGKTAAVAFGTSQAWIEGSQEWLFHISAAGLIALYAARSSLGTGQSASDPFWGEAGLFTTLGLNSDDLSVYDREDYSLAATRARLKRFPVCACNQVPLVLLQSVLQMPDDQHIHSITAELPPAEATYPGIARNEGIDSWSARVMSLPYSLAVMVAASDFTISDLRQQPHTVTEADIGRMQVIPDSSLSLGNYRLLIRFEDGTIKRVEGTSASAFPPERAELSNAATSAVGADFVATCLSRVDQADTVVTGFLDFICQRGTSG